VIEVKTHGVRGDIALDNFNFVRGNCSRPSTDMGSELSKLCGPKQKKTIHPLFEFVQSRCDITNRLLQGLIAAKMDLTYGPQYNLAYASSAHAFGKPVAAGITVVIKNISAYTGACLNFDFQAKHSTNCHVHVTTKDPNSDGDVLLAEFSEASEDIPISRNVTIPPGASPVDRSGSVDRSISIAVRLDAMSCREVEISHVLFEDGDCREHRGVLKKHKEVFSHAHQRDSKPFDAPFFESSTKDEEYDDVAVLDVFT